MGRLVYHSATEPIRLDPQDKPVFICACGLSQNMPHCDGSHSYCRKKEQPGKLYTYNKDRTEITGEKDEG